MICSDAMIMLRMILGDESESIWSDKEALTALNMANRRIMARIAQKHPESFTISYEEHSTWNQPTPGDLPTNALEYPGAYSTDAQIGHTAMNLWQSIAHHSPLGGSIAAVQQMNIIKVVRLFYSRESSLTNLIEIPLVPFSALEEKSEVSSLEYEVMSNMRTRGGKYKASYMKGSGQLFIRPNPQKVLYLKLYFADAGAQLLMDSSYTISSVPLLMPWFHATGSSFFPGISPLSGVYDEAVVYDAAYTLSFKDQSLRQAYAAERERIMGTQDLSVSPQEAY